MRRLVISYPVSGGLVGEKGGHPEGDAGYRIGAGFRSDQIEEVFRPRQRIVVFDDVVGGDGVSFAEVGDHQLGVGQEAAAGGVGGDNQDRAEMVLVGPLDFVDDEMAIVRGVPEKEGGWGVDCDAAADEGAAFVLVPDVAVDFAVVPELVDVGGEDGGEDFQAIGTASGNVGSPLREGEATCAVDVGDVGDDAAREIGLFVVGAEIGGCVRGCAEFEHCGAGALEDVQDFLTGCVAVFQAGPDVIVNVEGDFAAFAEDGGVGGIGEARETVHAADGDGFGVIGAGRCGRDGECCRRYCESECR